SPPRIEGAGGEVAQTDSCSPSRGFYDGNRPSAARPIATEERSMRTKLIGSTLIVALLTVLGFAADGPWKPVLSESELGTMVAADAKIIADTLAKGTPDKKGIAKIRAAALMIATYAQGAGDAQAGLRDIALKIGKAASDGKFDEVK